MEGKSKIEDIKRIFKDNFIGKEELSSFFRIMGTKLPDIDLPYIPYDLEYLNTLKDNYILIYGFSSDMNKLPVNIEFLRLKFGIDPDQSEPCFYNQDWYLHEEFINNTLGNRWYLIRKEVLDSTRSLNPDIILNDLKINFPSAILTAYTFFAYYSLTKQKLWEYDFIWCNDKDHNGDRIYVGKYTDVTGINKSGFSIHRHLSIRNFYGSIEEII